MIRLRSRPQVPEAYLKLHELVGQPRAPYFHVAEPANTRFCAELSDVGEVPFADHLAVGVRIGTEPALCFLPRRFLQHCLAMPPALFTSPALLLALDAVFGDVLDQAEAVIGTRLLIESAAPAEREDRPALLFTLDWGANFRGLAALVAAPTVLERIAAALPLAPRDERHLDHVPLMADLIAGRTQLTMAAFSSLSVGDAVVMDISGHALRVADWEWPVTIESGEARILASAAQLARRQALKTSGSDLPIEQVPIELTFALSSVKLPLGELRALRAGSMVAVGAIDPIRVDLLANGARIGTGKLVQMGDQAAVEVERMVSAERLAP
jgi:type III secretion protein Q